MPEIKIAGVSNLNDGGAPAADDLEGAKGRCVQSKDIVTATILSANDCRGALNATTRQQSSLPRYVGG